jgi:dGTPase
MEAAQITRTVAKALRLNADLAEAVALAHDLGHTPFGHAGERVLNHLMDPYGGFEHNAQSLRIVDELEERYADFRGLNLTWEVREGIVKHTPPYDKPLAAQFAPGQGPCLEAQLVDYTDEVAYNSHDIDDGLKSGLLSFEQLDGVTIWCDAYRSVRDRHPSANQRIWRYQAIRLIIDRLVTDLIETVERRLVDERIGSVADLRAFGRPLVGHSEAVEAQRLELKRFLMTNLYRHYRVMRMAEKARRVMSELFQSYLSEPLQLPPHILERQAHGDTLPRVIADYIAGMTDRFVLEEHRKLFDPFEKG